jgi:hypothetical protein
MMYSSWIDIYLHTQRLLSPKRASSIRCTRYYLVWSSLPMTCQRFSLVISLLLLQRHMPTRIHIKGTHMMDKKTTNRFDRRSELPINRGRHVQYICPLKVSNYFTSV